MLNALLNPLLGDAEVESHLSADADLAQILVFEAALAEAEADHGLIPRAASDAIVKAATALTPDQDAIAKAFARDGVVVPELVRQLRAAVPAPFGERVHVGATSQDAVDTSLVLRLQKILALFETRLAGVDADLAALDARFGRNALMAHTRMQDALKVTVGHRIAAWRAPLPAIAADLAALREKGLHLQLGGPVGTLDALGDHAEAIRISLADRLGLPAGPQWQANRQPIAALGGALSALTGALGKLGQDIALMAQNGLGEIVLAGGGGSSSMAHKSNPVRAEVLVALARANATLLSGLHQALIHEQERSGAAWTLEWLTLPPMLVQTGAALNNALALLGQVRQIGARA